MKKSAKSLLFALPILEGIAAAVWTVADRSEAKNALLLGLSGFRLGLFALLIALTVGAAALFRRRCNPPKGLWFVSALGFAAAGWLLLFSRFPNDDSRCLIHLIVSRALPLVLWLALSSAEYLAGMALSDTEKPRGFTLFCFLAALFTYWAAASHYDAYNWNVDLRGTAWMILVTAAAAVLWYWVLPQDISHTWKILAGCVFFALMSFTVIRSTQLWMGRVNTPAKAYWNELAESFLAGRLDLIAPNGFHDLTEYNGKWYVPNPPMPAILLIPVVKALGSAEAVNMAVYSAVLGALNAALLFWMLATAFTHSNSPLFNEADNGIDFPGNTLSISIWVTALFIFGTDLFWLATTGQMWFISQLVVTLFTLLAAIFALRGDSPILIGIMLGCAVLSRPNVCTVYFLLLGIWLYQNARFPENTLSISIWVTALFIFGTDLFWLATTGQMWFISQLVVTLFTLLAAIFALRGDSPILIGVMLGCAVLSRPNVCTVYFLLLGIWLYQNARFPTIPWKDMIVWGLKSGIPVVICVGLLLLYNKLRFNAWMDFGYVTINGADWILESVQKWGMFNTHFFKTNADVMLFGLPRLDFSGERFFFYPYVAGYSIFLMTPPLIYAFRSFRHEWFSVGSWLSVLVTVALLLMYHNTGAEQIGYRYILDAAAPLALMVADGTRGKVSPLFKILTVFAVCLSFVAIYWWYLGRV